MTLYRNALNRQRAVKNTHRLHTPLTYDLRDMALVFIETSIFPKQINRLMDDDEYTKLQVGLIRRPDLGVIVQETGGIRKMRWAGSGRGKRGRFSGY